MVFLTECFIHVGIEKIHTARKGCAMVFFVVSGSFFFLLCSPQFDAYQTASSDAIAFKLILNKAWVFPFLCNWCIGKLVNWEVKCICDQKVAKGHLWHRST